MGRHRIILLLAIALPASGARLSAQDHYGQDFWLADTREFSNYAFTIGIANPDSTATANVTVFNVLEGTTVDTVAPCSVELFTFSDHDLGSIGTLISASPVYHVTSDVDVAVFVFEPLGNVSSNDSALVFPVEALGLSHRIANYCNPSNSGGQAVAVVATAPGSTNVQIVDGTQTVIDNVTIQQGQMFQRLNNLFQCQPAEDMTGWEVLADKPVAVFSGATTTSVGLPSANADKLLEQLLDEKRLSLGYPVAPFGTRPLGCTTPATCAADVFRFVATEDNTTLTTVPNVGSGTLQEGDFLEIATATPFVVTGDKPFFGYQYMASSAAVFGGNPSAAVGDPSLIAVLPPEQFRQDYIVHVEEFVEEFLNIVAPVGASLFLDNTLITADCDLIGTLNGTDYCHVRLPVSPGTRKVTSPDAPFGLVVSGFGGAGSHAYPGGMGRECVPGWDGWIQDTPVDVGDEPNTNSTNMWESEDIWVRHQPDPNLQFQHQHQNPVANVVNYVYVKVRNRGCEPLPSGELSAYFTNSATGLAWPANWVNDPPHGDLIGTQAVLFVASNGERVYEFPWTPTTGGHFCLLARLDVPGDPITFTEVTNTTTNARNNNNVANRNVNVDFGLQVALDQTIFIVRNLNPFPVTIDLELENGAVFHPRSFPVVRTRPVRQGAVYVELPAGMFEAWKLAGAESEGLRQLPGQRTFEIVLPFARLGGIPFDAKEEYQVRLHHEAPRRRVARPPFVVRQYTDIVGGRELDGGITYQFPD